MDNKLMNAFRPGSDRSGMTLIETLVALFVLGICIAGMCGLVVTVKQVNDRARDHYTAINLAKNRTERAKMFDFAEVPEFAEIGTVIDKHGSPTSAGRFQRITTVTAVKSNLYEVVVEVKIKDRETLAFDSESEKVRTYIADLQLGPPEVE
jgi:prepilin-type N-terminal cleavage/methylation domain-containing protein